MEVTREMMVKEAVKRMKMLKMLPQPINEFKEEGKLNLSEKGILFWLNDDQKQMVKDFEEENGGVVYHVIHTYTNIGEMFSFMYVSKNQEEWEMDRDDLEDGLAFCYVVNVDAPDCSEFGTIGVKPKAGGVERTW